MRCAMAEDNQLILLGQDESKVLSEIGEKHATRAETAYAVVKVLQLLHERGNAPICLNEDACIAPPEN